MKAIRVDPATCTVKAAAGVLWGELDRATQPFGLATTGGVISHTGSHRLPTLADDVIDAFLERIESMSGPFCQINGWVVGGAVSQVAEDAAAVGDRDPGFEVSLTAGWAPADAPGEHHRRWVRDGWEALRPHGDGVYANFISDDGPLGVEHAYGQRLHRLRAIKARHDPKNFFRHERQHRSEPPLGRGGSMTLVLVTGATGTVGSSVVPLVQERGMHVRAFVRDPHRAASALGRDVDLAVGDFADRHSLATAMKGVDRVFLACANHPRQFEYEVNVIDAAAASGVGRIVKLSAVGAEIGSPLEFWDAQGRIERHLRASGIPAVIVRPTTYMTGVLAAAHTISQLGKLFVPAGQEKIAMIDPKDVAGVAAIAVGSGGWEGRTLTLTGPEALTYGEIARDLSGVLGRLVEYVDVPDDQARSNLLAAGLPDWLVTNLITLFGLIRQGVMNKTTDTVQAVTGRPPRSFVQFATEIADAFRAP